MDNTLLEKSLELPPNERVDLAEFILASIDHEEDEIRHEWIAEIKNHIKVVSEGGTKLLDLGKLYDEN